MYHPESYWNKVAQKIKQRNGENIIAGDDEPFYRYKREKFLKLLHQISFTDKAVLEIGCGPGGNLLEVLKHSPKRLEAVDISDEMIALAKKHTDGGVPITKIDGQELPFENGEFDVSFTSTVLQHVTDDDQLKNLIGEICRVVKSDIYIFERIEKRITGHASNQGRPTSFYQSVFSQHGFAIREVRFMNVHVSYLLSGMIRKVFNKASRPEGEQVTKLSSLLQQVTLPFTSLLDKLWVQKRELAKIHFVREQ
jgi:ubiquinone/menaquinone biosynthesis C-methylase UbiE